MAGVSETSDTQFLELLCSRGAMSVAELGRVSGVTATAVRQRLVRLMNQELIERDAQPAGRGRPSHRYRLTDKARRLAGNNFSDLAVLLWNELRSVKDPEVRRGLLERIATGLAHLYEGEIQGTTVAERMESVKRLFAARRVPVSIELRGTDKSGAASTNGRTGPSLTIVDCPYPTLAEQDRGVCAMERMLFAQLVEAPLTLSQCRLDGHACCQFQTN